VDVISPLFNGKADHIVFTVGDINKTREFYEGVIGLRPNTVSESYVTYELGAFALCFKEIKGVENVGHAVVHIGIDFPTRAEVDGYFAQIKASNYQAPPEKILGGVGETGPYRFYVKDPEGYTLEFESSEGC
jgi:catechol 2,3-dioxygenase-like lactoylglutathione lyase family enzyme